LAAKTEGMVRYTRQNRIVELISSEEIDTQERLADRLRESGFVVTQATISRDIKELQLVKSPLPGGRYRYTLPDVSVKSLTDRFVKIFKETIQGVDSSGNMLVVKTLTGCANAACEAIDSLDFEHIIGTIAGDNTIFAVLDSPASAKATVKEFEELIRGR
jgi:transcriptional regulator of arginine metabolism